MEGATPDSLLALHDAGYREVLAHLAGRHPLTGDGSGPVHRFLDVGCGVGVETARACGPGRVVVGVDYDAETALLAGKHWGRRGDGGTDADFAAMDGARLGFAPGSFHSVCSSHIIEHFTMPELHVAELARICADDGTVYVITPNRPADFENPFHVYLFEPDELASLLGLFFDDVELLGLEGDAALKADFAARRVRGDKLLKLDALGLRHKIPRRWYVWSYEHALPLVYRFLGQETSGIGSGLDDTHFSLSTTIEPTTPAILAIARKPRRFPRS
jgi:SAM-dependent methyltransferase